ncbi:Mitochondrial matrix iron chaperone [Dimargaris xerosporica]|nr:Mitochondrial matrix iron chaperone [Dimargaris xerosporica]
MLCLRKWARILPRAQHPRLRATSSLAQPLASTWTKASTHHRLRCSRTPHQPWSTYRHTYSTTQYQSSTLSEGQYHDLSTRLMDDLFDNLEAINDKHGIPEFDVEYSRGADAIVGAHGTYVINKQPPNKQIWLSSPYSGPKRFDYDAEHRVWFYGRDYTTLHGLLNHELSEIVGQPVSVL